jgi:ATP-dependent DNA ligase
LTVKLYGAVKTVSDLEKLHTQAYQASILYAFDLLELNGKDCRPPPGGRKNALARLLAWTDGID